MANDRGFNTPTLLLYLTQLSWVICGMFFFSAILYWYRNRDNQSVPVTSIEVLLVGALFVVPYLLQLFGLRVLKRIVAEHEFERNRGEIDQNEAGKKSEEPPAWRFYLFCLKWTLCGLAIHSVVWIWYVSGEWNIIGQIVTILCIILLLTPAIRITYAILESPGSKEAITDYMQPKPRLLRDIKNSASAAPYWALLFFIALFLIINYLFSFAFGLHDRAVLSSSHISALYMQPMPIPTPTHEIDPSNGTVNLSSSTSKGPYEFFFESNKARLLYDQAYTHNKRKLDELVTDIDIEIRKGMKVILTLKGQADKDTAVAPAYSSNYELSEARALRMKNEIMKNLSSEVWHTIEWHHVPLSNDDDYSEKKAIVTLIALKEQFLQQPQKSFSPTPFSLLSLVVYVITGADFGDVIPRTSYGKFLVSFAHIIQIFFLVALFSAVLTLQKPFGKDEDTVLTSKKTGKITEELISKFDDLFTKVSGLSTKVGAPGWTNTALIFPAGGGFGVAEVTESVNVRWEVKLPEWINIQSERNTSDGNVVIEYLVQKNEDVRPRLGQLIIKVTNPETSTLLRDQIINISQKGCSPIFSLSHTRMFLATTNSDEVIIHAPENCPWKAISHTEWIKFHSDNGYDEYVVERLGSGKVMYYIDKNTSGGTRTGEISIAGQTFTVKQAKNPYKYEIQPPPHRVVPAESKQYEVIVKSDADCEWETISCVPWIIIISGKSETGNGSVKYYIEENKGDDRHGKIVIAGQEFLVTQTSKKSRR